MVLSRTEDKIMSYTKAREAVIVPITVGVALTGTDTLHGPIPRGAGEIIGADISTVADLSADDGSNKWVITVQIGSNVAFTIDTGTTDVNDDTVAFTTESATVANKRFNGTTDNIDVVFTETGTAQTIPVGATIYVHMIYVYDHADE